MKALIIDDEPKARSIIHKILSEHCHEISAVSEAESIKEAVKLINKLQPEIVFLDIEMPIENGFALFNYIENPKFKTVFCTAYSEYAIQAFEVSAIDYLLKPVSISKIQDAVQKVASANENKHFPEQVETLKINLSGLQPTKIVLPSSDGLLFVKLENTIAIEANGFFSTLYIDKEKININKTLKEIDELLNNDKRFFRIHRSHIVNINHIQEYHKKDGNYLTMSNKKDFVLGNEKKLAFESIIQNLSL